MRRKRLTQFGDPVYSKTPSPTPTESANTLPRPPKAADSAPLSRKSAVDLARSAPVHNLPSIFDYSLIQLARVPGEFIAARNNSAVIQNMMSDLMQDNAAFLAKAVELKQNALVKEYAKACHSKLTLDVLERMINAITSECGTHADLMDRISYLAETIEKGANLEVMLDSCPYFGSQKIMATFIEKYQQLTAEQQQYVAEKMAAEINDLPAQLVPGLMGMLPYAERHPIPRQHPEPEFTEDEETFTLEPDKLPPAVIEAIRDRINTPMHSYDDLTNVVSWYIELAKKVTVDPSECKQVLVNFLEKFVEIKDASSKRMVINAVIQSLLTVKDYNEEVLQGILDFAASDNPANSAHEFPKEILLAIHEKIHHHKFKTRLGSIVQQLIDIYSRQGENKRAVLAELERFLVEFRTLSGHVRDDVLTLILRDIIILILSKDFNVYREVIDSVRAGISSITLDAEIGKIMAFKLDELAEFILKYSEQAELKTVDPSARNKVLTDFMETFVGCSATEKAIVGDKIIQNLQRMRPHEVGHLHAILEFAATGLQGRVEHQFPAKILLAISGKIHDHKKVAQLGSILLRVNAIYNDTKDMTAISRRLHRFLAVYRRLPNDDMQWEVSAVIAQDVRHLSGEDFKKYHAVIDLIQSLLGSELLNAVVADKERFEKAAALRVPVAKTDSYPGLLSVTIFRRDSLCSVENTMPAGLLQKKPGGFM